MEQLKEVHGRSAEDAGTISSELLIGLMPEVSFINTVHLTSLAYSLNSSPLRNWVFPKVSLAEAGIGKRIDKKKKKKINPQV